MSMQKGAGYGLEGKIIQVVCFCCWTLTSRIKGRKTQLSGESACGYHHAIMQTLRRWTRFQAKLHTSMSLNTIHIRLRLRRHTPKVRRHCHIPNLVVKEKANHTYKQSMTPMLDDQGTKECSQKENHDVLHTMVL